LGAAPIVSRRKGEEKEVEGVEVGKEEAIPMKTAAATEEGEEEGEAVADVAVAVVIGEGPAATKKGPLLLLLLVGLLLVVVASCPSKKG
jgi:hypothetical protein